MADLKSTKVVTGKVRFSYAHVFEPQTAPGSDKAQYSVSVLIPKSDKETLAKIKSALEAAKESGRTSKWGGKVPAKLHNPLRDGDEERGDDPSYVGHYFINAKSNNKPGVVDRQLNEIIDRTEFYSGCYGRASITFFPFASSGNNGIGVGLNHVQKTQDGEPLGGVSRASDDFSSDMEDDVEDFL